MGFFCAESFAQLWISHSDVFFKMVGKTRNRCGYLLIGCDKYLATSYRQLLSYTEFAQANLERKAFHKKCDKRNLLNLTVIPLQTLQVLVMVNLV